MSDHPRVEQALPDNSLMPAANAEVTPAQFLIQAAEAGVDLQQLRRNLRLTPAERLARLQAGIRMVKTLRSAIRL